MGRSLDGLERSPASPSDPVTWSTPLVRDGQHLNSIRQLDVDDIVGEALHDHAADILARKARRSRTETGIRLDPFEGLVECGQKFVSESRAPRVVPVGSFGRFDLSFFADAKEPFQRGARPRLIRSRISGHGRPASSPERARAARRSISTAQAASASLSGAPSKLARSSTANSARWSSSSSRALRKISSVAFVTPGSVLCGGPSNKRSERTGAQPARPGWAAVGAGCSICGR
jgi:hypothetical protein